MAMHHYSQLKSTPANASILQTASVVNAKKQIQAQQQIKLYLPLKESLDAWTPDGWGCRERRIKQHPGKSYARQSEVTLLGSLSAVM